MHPDSNPSLSVEVTLEGSGPREGEADPRRRQGLGDGAGVPPHIPGP